MTWRFPTLEAKSLEDEDLLLPKALAGNPSIVIVAFDRNQQREVDTWLPWLGSLRERLPGLEVFELPAIKRRWLPARGLIDGAMRAAISDPGTRQRTLTAYTDVSALTSSLRIPSTSAIGVLVVSQVGTVAWSECGAYDPAAAANLERATATARSDEDGSDACHGS